MWPAPICRAFCDQCQAWLADILAGIANHKITDLGALLPWAWRGPRDPHRLAASPWQPQIPPAPSAAPPRSSVRMRSSCGIWPPTWSPSTAGGSSTAATSRPSSSPKTGSNTCAKCSPSIKATDHPRGLERMVTAEPRAHDLRLAERLGFERAPPEHVARGNPVEEWLNEAQALLICMRSDAPGRSRRKRRGASVIERLGELEPYLPAKWRAPPAKAGLEYRLDPGVRYSRRARRHQSDQTSEPTFDAAAWGPQPTLSLAETRSPL